MGAMYQNIVFHPDGAEDLGGEEDTSGASYQEYRIAKANATMSTYYYKCCPNDPYPVARYDLIMNRALEYYVHIVIVPTILLTLLSFTTFLQGLGGIIGSGRFGFGITLVLVVTTAQTTPGPGARRQ